MTAVFDSTQVHLLMLCAFMGGNGIRGMMAVFDLCMLNEARQFGGPARWDSSIVQRIVRACRYVSLTCEIPCDPAP